MSPLNILVVGASIAGPSTAYWLARAGHTITVIERYPSLRTGGQNIDIRSVGVQVMRKIPGMEPAVRKALAPLAGLRLMSAKGEAIATMMSTGDADRQSLVSEYEIFRGDLSRILVDCTRARGRVRYVFGEQVASMRQEGSESAGAGGKVVVEFLNGNLPAGEYDLVVACDGATSRTRAMGLNAGVRDHIHSMNAWASYWSAPAPHDVLNGSKLGHASTTVRGRFLSVAPDHDPKVNRMSTMTIGPRGEPEATDDFRAAQKQGGDAVKELVKKKYAGADLWKVDEILKTLDETDDFYASEMVQVKVPSIVNGRFALVGDAGYGGAPGLGTSLALAGGYILAGEICKHKGDLAAGLKGYEERMKPLLDDMTKVPWGVPGVMAPQTAWGIWFRNLVLAFGSKVMEILGPYWSESVGGNDKHILPDYDWVE